MTDTHAIDDLRKFDSLYEFVVSLFLVQNYIKTKCEYYLEEIEDSKIRRI
jgi:hypothetical protein